MNEHRCVTLKLLCIHALLIYLENMLQIKNEYGVCVVLQLIEQKKSGRKAYPAIVEIYDGHYQKRKNLSTVLHWKMKLHLSTMAAPVTIFLRDILHTYCGHTQDVGSKVVELA